MLHHIINADRQASLQGLQILVCCGYLTCIEASNLTFWVEQREESLCKTIPIVGRQEAQNH